MLRRLTAVALLAAAALTAPAAATQVQSTMGRHCDTPAASAPAHDGMHHEAPAPGPDSCSHCQTTACLTSNHCTSGNIGLTVAAPSVLDRGRPAPRTPHPAPVFASRTSAPPTPPPDSSPIAS
jgi:hypothetical protein